MKVALFVGIVVAILCATHPAFAVKITMPGPKKLINRPDTCVSEAVEGLVLSDNRIKRLGDLNVVVRSDIATKKQDTVSLISGGGAGHEPAHAGFIGDGMLSAAVIGNVFASPSVSSILATIRAVAGPKGVLLIVKNYTGDRLNFGMALEQAKQEGINAKMVIVADDCALAPEKGITGGRGIAGTVFVHKVAGAVAASGASLEEVYEKATAVSSSVGTLGIALTTCTVPGTPASDRLDDPHVMEVGMGIHGEPGREHMKMAPDAAAAQVADLMVGGILGDATMAPRVDVSASDKLVLLLNNLGGLPVIETLVVAKEVMDRLKTRGLNTARVFMGPQMTALEMAGISLSVLKVSSSDSNMLDYLDAPTTAPAWTPAAKLDQGAAADTVMPYSGEAQAKKVTGGFACASAVLVAKAICKKIIEIEPILTDYDMKVGDGDCGVVMKAGATNVLSCMEGAAAEMTADSATFCDSIANAISASMGGTSGALLEIFFRAAATDLSKGTSGTESAGWISALRAGSEAIQFYGGAKAGMRTMLDALVPGLAALDASAAGGNVGTAADAATAGAQATAAMGSLAGRSNYIAEEQLKGVPDPGAIAIASAFQVAKEVMST
jgi:dihydroxyacetone kinase